MKKLIATMLVGAVTQGDEMHGFDFGVTLGAWRYGKGQVILNAFRLFEGKCQHDPYAARLMLNLATGDCCR